MDRDAEQAGRDTDKRGNRGNGDTLFVAQENSAMKTFQTETGTMQTKTETTQTETADNLANKADVSLVSTRNFLLCVITSLVLCICVGE